MMLLPKNSIKEYMEKKYQVFVSSTYEDLIDERKEATQALLETGCIPAGMELFPASNKQQWDIIKRVIDDSDYYMLIVAGRYGSLGVNDEGKRVSYTEMEFDYAISVKKPIIAFVHCKIGEIISSKVEQTKNGKLRLDKFINKVMTGRTIKYWDNKENLKSAILNGIRALIKEENLVGWVRGDSINEVSIKYRKIIQDLKIAQKNIDILTSTNNKLEQEIKILKHTNEYLFDNYTNINTNDRTLEENDEDYFEKEIIYSRTLEYAKDWKEDKLTPRIMAYEAAPKAYRLSHLKDITNSDSIETLYDNMIFLEAIKKIETNAIIIPYIDDKIKEIKNKISRKK